MRSFLCFTVVCLALCGLASGAQEEPNSGSNSTTTSKRLFTYSGPMLPSDWSVVSILNDRAVIGFQNGSARNSHLDELDQKDRAFLQRLRNGTIYSTPLSSTKEKLAQWSSQFTSTVSKFSKTVKDQLDSLINNTDKNKNNENNSSNNNGTILVN